MDPELSRRLALIVDLVPVKDRQAFVKRVAKAKTWDDLKEVDQQLVEELEKQL